MLKSVFLLFLSDLSMYAFCLILLYCFVTYIIFILDSLKPNSKIRNTWTWIGLKLQKLTRMTTLLQKFPNIFVITLIGMFYHDNKSLLSKLLFHPWGLIIFSFQQRFGKLLSIIRSPESPGKGAREPVLVLVHNHEALNLLHLVAQDIHQLLHKFGVSLIL